MSNKMLDYLKNSKNKFAKSPTGNFSVNGLSIYIKEPVTDGVDVEYCFSYVLEKIPKFFYKNLNKVFIGQFPFLRSREVDAIYKDGCIYITNNQETNETLIADLVHELAHCFEELHNKELYGDEEIKQEFVSRRKSLYNLLKANSLIGKQIKEEDFYNTEYDIKFDDYLYRVVGYDKIGNLSRTLFISPYAATCLREYFANAFETFFTKDMFIVKQQTPSIYKKLINYLEF